MGIIKNLDSQRDYVKALYQVGASCPVCGKAQTPWQAAGVRDAEAWLALSATERKYECIECRCTLVHEVYVTGEWGWGNPAIARH